MRVLVLSQHLEPEPLPKAMEVAQALQARGHAVTILTGLPNYPFGKLYPGYKLRLIQREVLHGIPVVRTILYPSHSKSTIARIVNYGSFMISSVLGAFFTPTCDVIYVRHPPLTVGVSAWVISRLKGSPFVYDVQDIWPESGVWSGMLREGWLVRFLRVMERFVYARAKHILVVTEGARQNMIGKGVPPERISVVSQFVDEGLFATADPRRVSEIRKELGLEGRFSLMFAGNVGIVQGLDAMVEAAGKMGDASKARFIVVGDGSDRERLACKAKELGLDNVLFIGRRPLEDMPHYMAAADAMLLSLTYSDMCELSIPLKTFAYLAASRPIVAAIRGAAAEIVEKAGAGVVVPPEDAEALASAVRRMSSLSAADLKRLGDSGRSYIVEHHAKEKTLDNHIELIRQAAFC